MLPPGTLLHGHRRTFEVLGELRRGGMGVVYLVRDGIGAVDSLAVAKVALDASHLMGERFRVEIAAIRLVDHPQVVKVIDDGEIDGRRWYAMDHVGVHNLADVLAVADDSGQDLLDVLAGLDEGRLPALGLERRCGLPLASAVHLLEVLAEAVAAAHARGVLHRDLKPANILLREDGAPVLCDFGVAQAAHMQLGLTADDEVVGTVAYIAPEQLAGAVIDARADVYALGAILHECLCGRPPPRRAHRHDPLPGLRAVPPALAALCRSCLDPEPERRPESATALALALAAWKRGESGCADGPPPLAQVLWRSCVRHPWRSVTGLAALVLLISLTLLVMRHHGRDQVAWLPASELRLDDPGVRVISGLWRRDERGAQPLDGLTTTHEILAGHLTPAAGLRVEIEAEIPERTQEIGLHVGGLDHWEQGYRFSLGAFENSCAVLTRDSTILWMGPGRVVSGTRVRLALERVHDHVRLLVDDRELAVVDDPQPPTGALVGVISHPVEVDGAGPLFRHLRVAQADLPALVRPAWPAQRLLGLATSLTAERRRAVLEQARALAASLAAQDGDTERAPRLRLLAALSEASTDRDTVQIHGAAIDALPRDDAAMAREPLYHALRLWSEPPAQRLTRLRHAQGLLGADEMRRLLAWCYRHTSLYRDPDLLLDGGGLLDSDDPLRHLLISRGIERLHQYGRSIDAIEATQRLAPRLDTWWGRRAGVEHWALVQLRGVLDGRQPQPISMPPGHARMTAALWLALMASVVAPHADDVPPVSWPMAADLPPWPLDDSPIAWASAMHKAGDRLRRNGDQGWLQLALLWAAQPPPSGAEMVEAAVLGQIIVPRHGASRAVLLVAGLCVGRVLPGCAPALTPDDLAALDNGRSDPPSHLDAGWQDILGLVAAQQARRRGAIDDAQARLRSIVRRGGPAAALAAARLAVEGTP
jgi:serine/threonine protein kinase